MKVVRRTVILAAVAIVIAAVSGHTWPATPLPAALTSFWATIGGERQAPAAPSAPSENGNVIAGLLRQVHVVETLPGYERGCKRAQACSLGPRGMTRRTTPGAIRDPPF